MERNLDSMKKSHYTVCY